MQSGLWDQIGDLLNRHRCENISRNTAVEVPGYKETQDELEKLNKQCENAIRRLPMPDQKMFMDWAEKQEGMCSMEGQKAYCQGYVDGILLLSGLGLLKTEVSFEKLMYRINL